MIITFVGSAFCNTPLKEARKKNPIDVRRGRNYKRILDDFKKTRG